MGKVIVIGPRIMGGGGLRRELQSSPPKAITMAPFNSVGRRDYTTNVAIPPRFSLHNGKRKKRSLARKDKDPGHQSLWRTIKNGRWSDNHGKERPVRRRSPGSLPGKARYRHRGNKGLGAAMVETLSYERLPSGCVDPPVPVKRRFQPGVFLQADVARRGVCPKPFRTRIKTNGAGGHRYSRR